MVCDNCGQGDAVIQWTQIVKDEMATFHLCEKCAAAKGLETSPGPTNFPLTDFLAQIGEPSREAEGVEPSDACSFCGLAFSDFRETGRLGCPHCYSSFEPYLRNLLRRIHGGTNHVGKVYLPPDPTATERQQRLETLRRKLQRAVDREDFERAAELRDQIRAMEPV